MKDLLAYERTKIASERTLMAWVRTAVSLIGFGFSIPKFFAMLAKDKGIEPGRDLSPLVVGMLLVALGTLGVSAGIGEHLCLLRRITPAGRPIGRLSAAVVTAAVVGLVGVSLFAYLLV